ncbi:DUF485 domain-containing protein [Saccharopolyspora erythraea]|uniref:DUF485 domain-containing protein n=1 Tax=Saccharopolyspora erythraea TaxID=1836 RepID=UPI001BA643D2|nr:DUF485 domain-containing protein [Saccharopolyspora erythraea]QUH04739.1 DUF485 domain-containing protein [Saccharopolyspora erythraea]
MPHPPQSPPPTRSAGGRRPATFGAIEQTSVAPGPAAPPDFVDIAESPDFLELRYRLRAFVFPMSVLFLVWYLGYVVLAAYFPGFMSIRLAGVINVGLVMGIGQFASTLLITALYVRFAVRELDPRIAELRDRHLGGDPL